VAERHKGIAASHFGWSIMENREDKVKTLLGQIREFVSSEEQPKTRAERIAGAIREQGAYRWVGLFQVDEQMVSIIAWSGPGAPAYPTFPVTKGLTGATAIRRSASADSEAVGSRMYSGSLA
jgi:putative methionine-R-sulfoxide reductase with GAF domain